MGDQKRGETDRGEGERISEKNRELGGGGWGWGEDILVYAIFIQILKVR